MNTRMFELGQIVTTPAVLEAFRKTGESPMKFIDRHVTGDWDHMNKNDRHANELSLQSGARIFTAFDLQDQTRIWVITEADRSATTLLLPEDY